VPRFEPFLGIRYDLTRFDAAQVTAPPYDVITDAERAELVERSPHNAVLVDLPVESDGPDRYAAAGERLDRWRRDGILVTDELPSFTVYRMAYTDDLGRPATTIGVIGALTLSEPGEGDILPHEFTTPKAHSDRLDLLRGTQANLSAIWGLSLTSGLTELLLVDAPPLVDWTDEDGVAHTVWRVDDPERVAAIADAVATTPVVIADGHHRYETSLAYRDEVRALPTAEPGAEDEIDRAEVDLDGTDPERAEDDDFEDDDFEDDDFEDDEDVTAALEPDGGDQDGGQPPVDADGEAEVEEPTGADQGDQDVEDDVAADDAGAGPAEATMAFVVELVGDQLTVRPIHRLLSGLRRGIDLAQVLEPWFTAGAIVESYAVEKGSVLGRMTAAGAVALIRPDGSARLLTPKREAFEGIADLDSARLAHALSSALADEPPEIRYQHGVEHVVEAVASGEADAGFLLRPATVAQIAANAHAGDRMPPKTTFFHPKPKTGIVFRSLV
jgi:uncharacterized protein (DUF1015 family)